MHPNPIYRSDDTEAALSFARTRGFGVLTVAGPDGVMASHIPFVLHDDRIEAHLVRSNPIARHLRTAATEALLIVSGPDGYISPDWYLVEDQVPTWNYVAVHLRGTLRAREDDALLGHLEEVSHSNESHLVPKKIWTHHKMTPGVMDKMMRQIVPCRLLVRDIDATWKLGQNKSDSVRNAAADQMEAYPVGMEARLIAGMMRGPFSE